MNTSTRSLAMGAADSAADAVYRKVGMRLIPLLFICYIAAYLDRVNVGFAKLQMQSALQFSDAIYGLGAGIFFIGYFIFEIPSNLLLHKAGARRWIARIMISWGVLSAASMFVWSPMSFYVIRFLLGAAEAGFFPGIILYLTYWYPAERRGRATSLFMTAIAFAGIIGGPLSGWILKSMNGTNGWAGWQWLFLLEGLPSIALGSDVASDQVAFGLRQPLCIANPILQIEQHHKAERDRRQAFEQEQPLPTGPAIRSIHALEDPARQRPAEDAGECDGRHEQ